MLGNLRTQAQIAAELGVSVATVSRRIEEYGLSPVVKYESNGAREGATPALYDLRAFCVLQQQQQLQIAELHKSRQKKIASTLDSVGVGLVMEETINKLKDDHSEEGVKAKMANAVGFMAMLLDEIQYQKDIVESERREHKLELDDLDGHGTLEKWSEEHDYKFSCKQLAQISRRLGYEPHIYPRKKILTKEHANGVWTYCFRDLDGHLEYILGIAEQYAER